MLAARACASDWRPTIERRIARFRRICALVDRTRQQMHSAEIAAREKSGSRDLKAATCTARCTPTCLPHLRDGERQGRDIAIYSSGSVLAQSLLFSSVPSGDLTREISEFFDTGVGVKSAPESYARLPQNVRDRRRNSYFSPTHEKEVDSSAIRRNVRRFVRPQFDELAVTCGGFIQNDLHIRPSPAGPQLDWRAYFAPHSAYSFVIAGPIVSPHEKIGKFLNLSGTT